MVKARIERVKTLYDLLSATGPLPTMDKPIADVTMTDVIRVGIAATTQLSAVFNFDCEQAKITSMLAGEYAEFSSTHKKFVNLLYMTHN